MVDLSERDAGAPPGPVRGPRCPWVDEGLAVYVSYHDLEWGVPSFDRRHLFEMLCLEGAQAGLSWRTILEKREGYRALFHDFAPERVARMRPARLDRLRTDPRIVRHPGKIRAIFENARALLAMEAAGEDFTTFVWSFVGDRPRTHRYRRLADVPAATATSKALAGALRRRGFRFVGPTTAYAFMQAAGLVNDHLTSCPRHAELARSSLD